MDNVKVLIVDDELGMRVGAARVLKKTKAVFPELELCLDYQCDTASTGEEAIDVLRQNQYDLVLLDYKLPGISGLEVLDLIKSEKIEVTAIMMTAYASLEVAVSATKNGAFDFLAKPFSPAELESVVQKAAAALLSAKRAKQLASEKRRVRFEFISVLAHELKSPLAAVESYLNLMKTHALGEQIVDYDSIVERSMIRLDGMRRLILDLLDLTRIESGEKTRNTVLLDVITHINAAVENVSVEAEKRNISIDVAAPASAMFWGDAGEIQIICNNLVSNAVKYNRENGSVKISAQLIDDLLTVKVSDTGIGIEKEDIERLFSAFSRIRNKKTENIHGSGLGLSILKKLVEMYEGSIKLESEPDVGSTFTVVLKNIISV